MPAWREGDGRTDRTPTVVDREELDLAVIRKHYKAMHRGAAMRQGGVPRSNMGVVIKHANDHHRYHLAHIHEGPYTIVRRPDGRLPVAAIPRPRGWFTGELAVTRAELEERFREALPEERRLNGSEETSKRADFRAEFARVKAAHRDHQVPVERCPFCYGV